MDTPAAPTTQPSARTVYLLFTTLDYTKKTVGVDEMIAFTNNTGVTLNNIVLAVESNYWQDCFALESFNVDGAAASYHLNGHRFEIELPTPLDPGKATTISIKYNLNLPWKDISNIFGYNNSQINLTNWYPFVVPFQNGDWVLHDLMPFGEELVYDASDFEVDLKTVNPDAGVTIAASAPAESNGDWTRYKLFNARTIVLSASPYFQVTSQTVNGVTINSYYFSGHEKAGAAMLQNASDALNVYGSVYTPYAQPSLSVVETNYLDGMEYDGLVFLAQNFYNNYDGTPKNDLTMIGVHEIAHQWWFASVGNDQALEPWLDETLATYSEHIFYEKTYPNDVNWWWHYRVNYYNPSGYVDTTIYNGGSFRPYTNAVYLNGANFIDELRIRIGEDDFFAFLKDYAAQMAGRISSKADFMRILSQHTSVDYSDIIASYFQNP